MAPKLLRLPLLLTLAAALAGCPDNEAAKPADEPLPPAPVAATIEAFAADPVRIAPGGAAILSWRTTGALSLRLQAEGGDDVGLLDAALAEGQVAVTPAVTTVYLLTAAGEDGSEPATATARVTVEEAVVPLPALTALSVEPSAIAEGGEATISWQSTGATMVSVRASDGTPVPTGDESAAAGSVTVRPATDTTYAVTARGPGGEVTGSVKVTVAPRPRVLRFSASPAGVVDLGTEVTLSFAVADAARVVIVDAGGGVLADLADPDEGTLVVTPDFAASYTLTATGPGGEAVASVEVQVAPLIDSFTLAPGLVRTGDPVALAWAIRGADAATLTGPGGFSRELAGAELTGGSLETPLLATGDFVLGARRAGVERTWSIFAETTEAPRLRSFTASPAELTASAAEPGTVTLSWVADGATSLQLVASPGGLLDTSLVPAAAGSLDVLVSGDTSFQLVAVNDAGTDGGSAAVVTALPPAIDAFDGAPRRLAPGELVALSWETHDAVAIRLERDGVDLGVDPGLTDGGLADPVLLDSTYVLFASNRLGAEVASAPISVVAGPPSIGLFTVEPGSTIAGALVTFSWTTEVAVLVEVLEPGGVVACSTADPVELASGSCTVPVLATGGTHEYTLRVVNSAGQETFATASVFATDGPVIRSFTASAATVTEGGQVELSWVVDSDPQGVIPTLAVVDQDGTSYDVSALDPNAGTVTVTLPTDAAWLFTLTATTPGRIPATAQLTVEAIRVAEILAFTATPDTASTQGGTVAPAIQLAWTTLNGVQLELLQLDAAGAELLPALQDSADPAVIDAGSVQTTVSASTTFRLRIRNRIGTVLTAEVWVHVDPVAIVSFAAVPEDLIAGESTTLGWVTENADTVELQPSDPLVTAGALPLIDVSTSPTATQLVFSSQDTAGTNVVFPQGFAFPFAGGLFTGARVCTNGWVGLDTASTSSTSSNTTLPSLTNDHIQFPVFWDDLDGNGVGSVWMDVQSDADGQFLVVQWKGWQFPLNTVALPADLNFELVLRANGNFEYRYGTMTSAPYSTITDQDRADGDSATIGFQTPDTLQSLVLSHNSIPPGGMSNRSWSFDYSVPASGSRTFVPAASQTFVLTAANEDGSVSAQAEVRVHPVVSISALTVAPLQPELGGSYRIAWTVSGGTEATLTDGGGAVVCTTSVPAQVASGGCDVPAPATGTFPFTLTAIGGIARNVATTSISVTVFPVLRVDGFSAPDTDLAGGESATLSWAATGSVTTTLLAGAVPVDISGQDPLAGSLVVTPAATTVYTLTIDDGLGRTRTATLTVFVDAARVDSLTASASQIPAGGSVTIDWTTTNAATQSNNAYSPMSEPALPFLDVSGSPTATRINFATADDSIAAVTFPAGFSFPWDGAARTGGKVCTNGFFSFDTATTSTSFSNATLPTAVSLNYMNLAVIWDDLDTKTTGQLWVDRGTDAEGDYLVIQWKNFQLHASTVAAPSDLNFEVILRANGLFEYRYGTMTAAAVDATTDQDRADGDSATIGYQDVSRTHVYQASHNTRALPGLSNRTFRFDPAQPPEDGSAVVTPAATTTYEVCASAGGYSDCRQVRVVVVRPGMVTLGELMILPAAGLADADAEYLELRNTSPETLDLSGWVLGSTGDPGFTFPAGTTLSPGAILTVGGSADPALNGGFAPDLVWAGALSLTDAADDVTLTYGALQVDRVAWDASWPIVAGRSLTLDPSHFRGDPLQNDVAVSWCPSIEALGAGLGSPGTLGAGCRFPIYDLDPAAPASEWIDIEATGTEITATYEQVPAGLGFTMPWFGGSVTELWITRSGMLAFAAVTSSHTANDVFPDATTPNGGVVGAFWDNLVTQTGTSVRHEARTVGLRQVVIVQWTKLRQTSSTTGSLTFQAQLWSDGEVLVVIKEASGSDQALSTGSSASSGIEDIAGTAAIQFSSNTTDLTTGRAIRYTRR